MPIEPTNNNYVNPAKQMANKKPEEESSGKEEKSRLEMQKDDFLKLMIESLKHQDPMNPMDSQKMMSQMAQLTTVEQITNMSKSVEKLSEAMVGSQLQQASSLLGKEVSAENNGEMITGVAKEAFMGDDVVELLINNERVQIGQIKNIKTGSKTD